MAESKDDRYKKLVKEYEDDYVDKKSKGPLPASEYTPIQEQRRRLGMPPLENDPRLKAQEEAREKIVGTKNTRGFAKGGKVRGHGMARGGKVCKMR